MALITLVLNYGSTSILDLLNVAAAGNESAVNDMLSSSVILAMACTVLFGPIVEELVFRKAINQIVSNKIIFIVVSALLFGFIHEAAFNLRIIPFALVGAMCAITYLKTEKNIIAPMIVHFISNIVFTIWMYLE